MFSCGLSETTAQQVELKETPLKPFKLVLGYMYSGELDLKKVADHEDFVDLLDLAHRFQLFTLATPVAKYMARNVCRENALLYLVHAHAFDEKLLEDACLRHLDQKIDSTYTAGLDLVDKVGQVP
jgi:hypothetical protein